MNASKGIALPIVCEVDEVAIELIKLNLHYVHSSTRLHYCTYVLNAGRINQSNCCTCTVSSAQAQWNNIILQYCMRHVLPKNDLENNKIAFSEIGNGNGYVNGMNKYIAGDTLTMVRSSLMDFNDAATNYKV